MRFGSEDNETLPKNVQKISGMLRLLLQHISAAEFKAPVYGTERIKGDVVEALFLVVRFAEKTLRSLMKMVHWCIPFSGKALCKA